MPLTTQTHSWWPRRSSGSNAEPVRQPCRTTGHDQPADRPPPADPSQLSLVETMLAHGRYAFLLRRQVVEGLSAPEYQQARDCLERSMALVPGGVVDVSLGTADGDSPAAVMEQVEPFFLDRYPITNRQFRQFGEAGGYELEALWDAQVWPTRAEFVDCSGVPGPRFWRGGRCPSGEDDHPVVGVNWHEATAYARWVGKRLPADAEWLKAAAWPVRMPDGRCSQRRFPWGDTIDRGRCNVWGSGPGRTAGITQFSAGVSVGGVYQLTGNVWEWNDADFEQFDNGSPLEFTGPMKTIRGGAFDTYFEQQASCRFRSGENPLARKHNIGFRCALSACDAASPGETP